MYAEGNPKPALYNTLEGWGGDGGERGFKREGTHVYLWPIHVDVRQKPSKPTKPAETN